MTVLEKFLILQDLALMDRRGHQVAHSSVGARAARDTRKAWMSPNLLTGLALLGGCAANAPQYKPVGPTPAQAAGVSRPANSAVAEAVLRNLDELQGAGVVQTSAGNAQVAAPYTAASGRQCRLVTLPGGLRDGESELACRDEQVWFYVPQVFAGHLRKPTPPTAPSSAQGTATAAPVINSQGVAQAVGETETP